MKSQLVKILLRPLTQIISFSIILVGSPYFGGPYLFFVLGSFKEGYAYGILGMIGICLTIVSAFVKSRGYTQVGGLLCMLLSLAIFFFSSAWENAAITILNPLALITLLMFVSISVLVTLKMWRWKNY